MSDTADREGPSVEALAAAKSVHAEVDSLSEISAGAAAQYTCDDGANAAIIDRHFAQLRAKAAMCDELAEALRQAEWSGNGPHDGEEFYCPTCKAHHPDCEKIPHETTCTIGQALARHAAATQGTKGK